MPIYSLNLKQARRDIIAHLVEDAAYRCQIAQATAAIEPVTLAQLFRSDKALAAAALVALNALQLVSQAIAYAAWLNEAHHFSGEDVVDSEDVLENFQRGIAAYGSGVTE